MCKSNLTWNELKSDVNFLNFDFDPWFFEKLIVCTIIKFYLWKVSYVLKKCCELVCILYRSETFCFFLKAEKHAVRSRRTNYRVMWVKTAELGLRHFFNIETSDNITLKYEKLSPLRVKGHITVLSSNVTSDTFLGLWTVSNCGSSWRVCPG